MGQYAAGFERLGYDVYYVEAHARTPFEFMENENDGGTEGAAHYVSEVARRFGLGDRWAFQALHEDGRTLGMTAEELDRLYRDAALIINLHGGTLPLPEHAAREAAERRRSAANERRTITQACRARSGPPLRTRVAHLRSRRRTARRQG